MSVVYVTQQGAGLNKEGERLLVRKDHKTLLDVPLIHIKQVVLFGNVTPTAPAISLLLKRRIDVVFLSVHGRYKGRLQPEYSQTVDLRKQQYLGAEDHGFCLDVAKAVVSGKIHNALQFCSRQRKRPSKAGLERLKRAGRRVESVRDLDALRGHEGAASSQYFGLYRELIKPRLGFTKRVKRPPTDPVNVLLSLGYTLLFNSVYAMVNVVGLDPYQGFYHQDHTGHPTLVSDLMEEFRSIVVDSAVLWVVNKGLLTADDFTHDQNGQLRLSAEGLKRFLKHYEDRLQTRIFHPLGQGRVTYLYAIELQARLLARVLRGEAEAYQSFAVA